MGSASKNFDLSDFSCHCATCKSTGIHTKQAVINEVQKLRDILGGPVVVTRGVSCAEHNAVVGGSTYSRHLPEHADAVDILAVDDEHALELVSKALSYTEFRRFRVYPHHIHMDMKPGPRIFLASPE